MSGSGNDDDEETLGSDDRTIATQDGTVAEPESWPALVQRALAAPGEFIVVSSGPPQEYAQAMNDGGDLRLEYRDGSPDRHFCVCGVGLEDVAVALGQWFEGRREFVADHDRQRIEV